MGHYQYNLEGRYQEIGTHSFDCHIEHQSVDYYAICGFGRFRTSCQESAGGIEILGSNHGQC